MSLLHQSNPKLYSLSIVVLSGMFERPRERREREREREIALEVEKQRGLATIFGRWGLYREIREERECHAYAAERGVHGQNRDLGS